MPSCSQFFSRLYTFTVILLYLILHEAGYFVRLIAKATRQLRQRPILRQNRLARVIEKRFPAKCFGKRSAEGIECAVCLSRCQEGEAIRELRCSHVFHRDCVDKWLEHDRASTCPLCRRTQIFPEDMLMDENDGSNRELEYEWNRSEEDEFLFIMSAFHFHGSNMNRLF